jgi:hypothetical protein
MPKVILLIEDLPATATKEQGTPTAKKTFVQVDSRSAANAQSTRTSRKNITLFVQDNFDK